MTANCQNWKKGKRSSKNKYRHCDSSVCRWNQLVLPSAQSRFFFADCRLGSNDTVCYLRGACSYRLFLISRQIF